MKTAEDFAKQYVYLDKQFQGSKLYMQHYNAQVEDLAKILEAYGKQNYDRGIGDAAKFLESRRMFRAANKIHELKDKKK